MSNLKRALPFSVAVLVVLALFLSACATQPAPVAAPGKADSAKAEPAAPSKPAAAPTNAEPAAAPAKAAPEKTAPPAAPKPAGPQVGGTLVWAVSSMGDSLDTATPGATSQGNTSAATMLSGSLLTRDLQTGQPIPYLAESWKASADGLTYEFKLKKNVKWHDGTPLTAKDFVYTLERVKGTWLASLWNPVVSAQAPDDSTLVLKLSQPDATFIATQAQNYAGAQPFPKQAIEKLGDKFGLQPVSSGPFKIKEFQIGSKIVLERNPDYNWGPSYMPGAPYLQNLEIRLVKEYATILAGLETGEIDFAAVDAKDVDRLKATGKMQVGEWLWWNIAPTLLMNTSKAPWDDVRVRQAVNLALDSEAILKVAALGKGVVQKGPLPTQVFGYWPGVEQIGYRFDLNKAKALMKEAGYTAGSDGILAKDGKPLKFTAPTENVAPFNSVALMVKEQLKALGIDLEIKLLPRGEMMTSVSTGNYDAAVWMQRGLHSDGRYSMKAFFHSAGIGGTNWGRVKDPKLDELLQTASETTDTAKSVQLLADAQKLVVDKAYSVPIYTPKQFFAIANRVKGITINDKTFYYPQLQTAYIEGGR